MEESTGTMPVGLSVEQIPRLQQDHCHDDGELVLQRAIWLGLYVGKASDTDQLSERRRLGYDKPTYEFSDQVFPKVFEGPFDKGFRSLRFDVQGPASLHRVDEHGVFVLARPCRIMY